MFKDLDLYTDRLELEELGLTEEEIEGYFGFFAQNFTEVSNDAVN